MREIQEKTIETYNKTASNYSDSHFYEHFWIREFNEYRKLVRGNKILDIACGAGRDATMFLKNNFDYMGIDASEKMLKIASKRVPKGKFKLMDFFKLDFLDNTFDGFWAAASFLHLPKKNIREALIEARRVLRPGGIGFITLKKKRRIDEGWIKEDKFGGIARYFAFYNQGEFARILKESGFNVIKSRIFLENDAKQTKWLCYFVEK
ncbi:MAG: methyltransferase domain-containing protein [Patescibacteria group bacterium]